MTVIGLAFRPLPAGMPFGSGHSPGMVLYRLAAMSFKEW